METKLNDISTSEKELEVSIAYEDIKNEIEAEEKLQAKKIQLPGFRKGKVPISHLRKIYGDALKYDASEKVANNKFWEIAEAQMLNPIGQPVMTDINFKPGENLSFKVKFEVVPTLELIDYTNQTIEIPDFVVNDKEVEAEIEYIIKSNATEEDCDAVGEDNNYKIDIELKRVDELNNEIPGTKPETLTVDLSDQRVHPELLNNSKGKKVGDVFSFTFKDESPIKNESGQDETKTETFYYSVKLKKVKKVVLPELSEELIKKITKDKLSTETEFRDKIRNDIQAYYDNQAEEITRIKLLNMILKNNDFTAPSSLVNNVLNDMIKHEEEHSKQHKVKHFDKEAAKQYLMKNAENEVKWYLIKTELIKKENIKVSDEELKEMAEKDSAATGISIDKLLSFYNTQGQKDKILDKKLFEFLKSKNTIVKVDLKKYNKKEEEVTT